MMCSIPAPVGAMLVGLLLFTNPVLAANIQVMDGGTLVVEGRTVRLSGNRGSCRHVNLLNRKRTLLALRHACA